MINSTFKLFTAKLMICTQISMQISAVVNGFDFTSMDVGQGLCAIMKYDIELNDDIDLPRRGTKGKDAKVAFIYDCGSREA